MCTLTKDQEFARVAKSPPRGERLPLYRVSVMEIILHIPDDIAADIRKANGQDIARHILEAYVMQAYQQRELGTAHLRRLLGFETRYEFEDFLAAHNVSRNYTLADLEQDRETARLLGL